MAIRMAHPLHGFTHAYNNNEKERLEALGWSEHKDELTYSEIIAIKEEYQETLEKAQGTVLDESYIRGMYLLKFGKKPHHMMKLENIKKALDDNS